jgi:hypothetical protein
MRSGSEFSCFEHSYSLCPKAVIQTTLHYTKHESNVPHCREWETSNHKTWCFTRLSSKNDPRNVHDRTVPTKKKEHISNSFLRELRIPDAGLNCCSICDHRNLRLERIFNRMLSCISKWIYSYRPLILNQEQHSYMYHHSVQFKVIITTVNSVLGEVLVTWYKILID